jgi:hypothetical protein
MFEEGDRMSDRRFSVYLSHSWDAGDVEFNAWVWKILSETCDLLVDKPESNAADPPYYINRLEELMRRTDLFVSVLTYRQQEHAADATGDALLDCSHGCLFEIRLAERANLPRFVLYDRQTGFRPPERPIRAARYFVFDRAKDEALPWNATGIAGEMESWLGWIASCYRPKEPDISDFSLLMLPDELNGADVLRPVEAALRKAKFFNYKTLPVQHQSDIEILRQLREAGLLIADVCSNATRDVYALAHGMFLPTIRVSGNGASLPWLLTGHPGGYQHDFISEPDPARLAEKIQDRAAAIFRITRPLDRDEGLEHIYSRRYKGQLVFLSHCLKQEQRNIIDQLVEMLRESYIPAFEYFTENQSGEDWKSRMLDNLRETSLFVALLTDGYEQSEASVTEWENIQSANNAKILPFLLYGRTAPHVKLKRAHHRTIRSDDPTGARQIADRITGVLNGKVRLE